MSHIHRKIYESHNGPIPKDDSGRTYEIHHVDGNHSNNSLKNLVALTIQEHYDIHFSQGDWAACHRIATKMKRSTDEISRLATMENLKRVENGTHPFLGGEISRKVNQKRLAAGTHNFQDREKARERNLKRVENGTHPFLGGEMQRENNLKRVANGTHQCLGGEIQRKRIADGTHNFTKPWKCEHCGKEGIGTGNYARYHGNNCKYLIQT